MMRIIKAIFFRLLTSLAMMLVIVGGGFLYLNYNPEAKQALFATVGSAIQDACQNVNGANVDLSQIDFTGVDLAAIGKTMLGSDSMEEKRAKIQSIGAQVAMDNEDYLRGNLKKHGVPDEKIDVAMDFQQRLMRDNIPLQLGPFLFTIKDSLMAEQYFKGLNASQVGANGGGAVPILAKAAKDGTPEVRAGAIQSLQLIGTQGALLAIENAN